MGGGRPALVDKALRPQPFDRLAHAVLAAVGAGQRALGGEHFVGDVERGEVVADHRHHRVDGALAHDRQPFRLGLLLERRAIFAREALADGLEIVAGIEAFGDRADVFAQSLAVAQEGRARQHVDLAAGVVDVIFARRLAAREDEQARKGVAEHRAARVADMHRARSDWRSHIRR